LYGTDLKEQNLIEKIARVFFDSLGQRAVEFGQEEPWQAGSLVLRILPLLSPMTFPPALLGEASE
jgi:hypothetical protein